MSISEFRYNKKRKHYAYLFKTIGLKRKNILITSKPLVIKHKNGRIKIIVRNIRLYRHPNKSKSGLFYIIPIVYLDDFASFDSYLYDKWEFDRNDKRKVKRVKKRNKIKK